MREGFNRDKQMERGAKEVAVRDALPPEKRKRRVKKTPEASAPRSEASLAPIFGHGVDDPEHDDPGVLREGWHSPPDSLIQSMRDLHEDIVVDNFRAREQGIVEAQEKKSWEEYDRAKAEPQANEQAKEIDEAQAKRDRERAALDERVKKNASARKAALAEAVRAALGEKPAPAEGNNANEAFLRQAFRKPGGRRPHEVPHRDSQEKGSQEQEQEEAREERRESGPHSGEVPPHEHAARDPEPQGRQPEMNSGSIFADAAEKYRNSPLGMRLASEVNNKKLRVMTERIGVIERDLAQAQERQRSLAEARVEHKRRFDALSGESRENAKGLRPAKRISESARAQHEAEERGLREADQSLQARIERLQASLAESNKYREELKALGLDIIKRAADRAERLITPERAKLQESEALQAQAKEAYGRFESMALKAEQRLAAAKLRMEGARSDSERMIRAEWMQKDLDLVKRLRGVRRGKNDRKGLEGWKRSVEFNDGAIAHYRAKIEAHAQFARRLMEEYEASIGAGRGEEPGNAAEAQPAREEPAPDETPASAETAEASRTETSEEPQAEPTEEASRAREEPKANRRERASRQKESAPEDSAARFAEQWNRRYGSSSRVDARELARIMPVGRKPNDYEMGSILETYLMTRPWGVWKWIAPALPGLFATVVKNRIRAMREVM